MYIVSETSIKEKGTINRISIIVVIILIGVNEIQANKTEKTYSTIFLVSIIVFFIVGSISYKINTKKILTHNPKILNPLIIDPDNDTKDKFSEYIKILITCLCYGGALSVYLYSVVRLFEGKEDNYILIGALTVLFLYPYIVKGNETDKKKDDREIFSFKNEKLSFYTIIVGIIFQIIAIYYEPKYKNIVLITILSIGICSVIVYLRNTVWIENDDGTKINSKALNILIIFYTTVFQEGLPRSGLIIIALLLYKFILKHLSIKN